jgi:hypothetical protein
MRWTALAALIMVGSAGCLGSFTPDPQQQGTSGDQTGGGSAAPTGAPAGGGGSGGGGAGGGGGGGGGGVGGGGGGSTGTIADMAMPPSSAQDMSGPDPNCIKSGTPVIDGHHNTGAACMGCHRSGSGLTVFTAAGTVYDAAGNGLAGVNVELVDAAGKPFSVVSASGRGQGNFWITSAVTLPLTVRATACPYDRPMVSKVSNGDCNTSGCHTSAMPIHVP